LLSVLYPHYLRPFPSCSIAHFEPAGSSLSAAALLPRGTELQSRPIKGAVCKFRTAWDVRLPPLAIDGLVFDPLAVAPGEVRLPIGCQARLSFLLALQGEGEQAGLGACGRVRFYIDAEPSVASALRDALFLRCLKVFAEGEDGRWLPVRDGFVGEVGFAPDESLIDMPEAAHGAYRHLTEYFCFPEKFNFFDLDLAALPAGLRAAPRLHFHFALGKLRADSDASRLLQTLGPQNLRLGCVPVVNLFSQRGDPIRVTHRSAAYPVVADGRRAFAYEVYSIDSVKRVRQTAQGETITEFRPFFSLRHGETPEHSALYWFAQRDPLLAESSPGYETSSPSSMPASTRCSPGPTCSACSSAAPTGSCPPSCRWARRPAISFWKVAPASAASACCASPPSPGVSTTAATASGGSSRTWRSTICPLPVAAWRPSRRCSPSTTCRAAPRRAGRSRACGRSSTPARPCGCPASPLPASCVGWKCG
jgi:type VI secretion system protein ImpG